MKSIYLFIISLSLGSCTQENQIKQMNQQLIDTDLAFSRLSEESGMNHAFSTYCATEGVLLRPGSMPVVGKTAISSLLSKNDDTGFTLTWEPEHSMVAAKGDMGYTYGIYTLNVKGSDSDEKGTYVSIWIKEEGQWKFVLDTGNEGLE